MKKSGKFEKQPKVKSALLQTYLTSLLCIVLCVAMFFGTSYAWFTSEIKNTGNEVYIGILKVGLYKGNNVDLSKSENKLFDGSIRWEPGYTNLETIKVVNEGDLAFKYSLNFTDGTISEGGDLSEVAKNFEVWVFDHYDHDYVAPTSYEKMAVTEGWTKIGTLADVLSGKPILEDEKMLTVREEGEANPNEGTTDGVPTTDTYTIALHMVKEASDSNLMGKKIMLNVKLVAYQMGSEEDSFGPNYDNVRIVSTADELQKELDKATGEVVIQLASNITGNVTVTQKENVKITVDGGNHEFKGTFFVDGKSARYDTAALTIQNVKFTGVTGEDTVYVSLGKSGDTDTRYTNHVTVKDCTFEGEDAQTAAIKSHTGGDKNLTIIGCTVNSGMHSLAQLKNVEEGLKIVNCKVYSKNGANLNNTQALEMTGCTFDVNGYAVRFGEGTQVNAYKEVFNISNCTLKSACAASDDAVIVFRGSCLNATLNLTNTTLEGNVKFLGNTAETIINEK